MKYPLKAKMILSYLAVALLTVLVVSALIRLTSGQSLMNLVVEQQTAALQEAVQEYYSVNGSLDGFFDSYIQAFRPESPETQPAFDDNPPDKPPQSRDIRGLHGLVDTEFRALMPTLGMDIGEIVPQEKIRQKIAVEVDGQVIAWILPDTSFQFKLSAEEQVFLQRTNLAIGLAAIAGVLAALGMGFFLASRLLHPIRLLTQAAQALARGDLKQQVPVTSQDELGLLTETFNQMSADLEHADQQRKRLTADITHDLSTPLQIISGYVEMLEEDALTLSPQRIEIIKTELENLRRLVGDLTTLSQVEAGGLEILPIPVAVSGLIERVYQSYQPIAARQGIDLRLELPDSSPIAELDEGRMMQVLKNLVENALRYTPHGGQITLGLENIQGLKIFVRDNGAGIAPEDLPYVFERFYRADKARSGGGKMGLGLSICKALIDAQGGTIQAVSDGPGLGTTILITLGDNFTVGIP